MRILTSAGARAFDQRAMDLGLPSLVLMENAAVGLADAIGEIFPAVREVVLFCGPGGNGGDGLALARQLATRGYTTTSYLVFGGREAAGDLRIQLEVARGLGLELVELAPDAEPSRALAAARRSDLLVDALFGVGLTRPLAGLEARLVTALSSIDVPRLAVDLPSGLSGDHSTPFGPHFVADCTVTFGTPKPAHVLFPAAAATGRLVVADLGVPAALADELDEPAGRGSWTTAEDAASLVIPRAQDGHKGTYGHLLIVAGGPGKAGAAVLAARASVRGGAGLVTVAVPAPLVPVVEGGSLESMTVALPADAAGGFGPGAGAAVLALAAGKQAVVLGPGLGTTAGDEIRRLVVNLELPLVLDADGLNAFAGRLDALAARRAPTILTPHPGELARMLGIPTNEVALDRLAAARSAARKSGAFVVAKGAGTLVVTPEGDFHVNSTGNPGLASGGSGDVLAGLLGALLAQGYEPLAAAVLGVYWHGLAADRLAARVGGPAIPAGDLAAELPAAFAALAAGEE
ncbi:MAG: NAD(P)H-hydrate dehydratase [Thermoanaerobaculia bacterium]|nr:NAD(P)H-hydrate dehydratase [Thermoanaerobaculia bacterium]